MSRTLLIEGILLFFISIMGMAEGLRLIRNPDPIAATDAIGPGYYVLFVSIALMAAGLTHLIVNYRKYLCTETIAVDKEMRIRMIGVITILAIYILLIYMVGYLVASIVFFLLEFRIVGIKSWIFNVILTLSLTAVFYIVFVYYCSMVFPKGIFF